MPSSERRLKAAPLVHVLVQVVFPPVPHWGERLDALKSAFYGAGFIRPGKVQVTEMQLGVPDQSVWQAEHRLIEQDRYCDKNERFALTFSDAGVVMQTSGYKSFRHLKSLMEAVLRPLEEIMQVAVVDRIGLRYVDLVQLQVGEHFGEYVHNGLLGFPFKQSPQLGVARVGFSTQSIGLTAVGPLAIRSAILPPGQFLPPDLESFGLRAPERVDAARPGLVVDFDHFSLFSGAGAQPAMAFRTEAILNHLETLHTVVKDAFLAIATDHAIAAWGGWEEIPE